MIRERIEIFPGHWIEVTPKLKKKAGVKQSARVIATLNNVTRIVADDVVKPPPPKYPRLMLEEANRIVDRDGMKAAVKATGINAHSIVWYRRGVIQRRGEYKPSEKGRRYTMEQKRACVRLAQKLMASGEIKVRHGKCYGKPAVYRSPKWSHAAAFREAGRRLGMNGRSVEWCWIHGMIPFDQQPSGA
jgi:hypothetical protein